MDSKRVKNWKELERIVNSIDPRFETIILTGFVKDKSNKVRYILFDKVTSHACKLIDNE